jgi:hypothetical protein
MIRKPPAQWQGKEAAPIRTIRTVVSSASRGRRAVRSGGHVISGLVCFFFAILWGFAALVGGLLGGSLPTFIGVGAMAALMAWCGRRAFAKARESTG